MARAKLVKLEVEKAGLDTELVADLLLELFFKISVLFFLQKISITN